MATITNRMRLEALIALVKESTPVFNYGDENTETVEEMVCFLEKQVEAMDKKNNRTSAKTIAEHEEIDERVLTAMTADKLKVSEITNEVNEMYDVKYTSSKITASLQRLCNSGKVINERDKKDSYYRLAD